MSRTFDIHAEYGVLASLMFDPSCFDAISGAVAVRDFANRGNRVLFEVISSMLMAGKVVDVLTVHSELQRRRIDSISVVDVDAIACSEVTARGALRYAENVRAASLERQLLSALDEAGGIATGEGELGSRLERIVALVGSMSRHSIDRLPVPVKDLALGRIDHYMALAHGHVAPGWRTGIPMLDRLLGGLKAGKVYVLAARPSVGKTSFGVQLGLTLAEREGLVGLVLTQEMPNEELADRAVANLGHVDYSKLQSGELSDAEWTAVTDGIERLSRLPLHFDDQAGLALPDIRAKARSIKGLRLLVIDYLQLCSGTGRRDANRNSEIEEISRGVKALAKELGCAVLLLSQLSREVEKRAVKEPELSDLRDSGAIEQDADVVIFLWQVREFLDTGHRLVGCKLGKNRGGPLGRFGLDFQGAYQRWAESDQDIRAGTSAPIARSVRNTFREGDDS